MFVFHVYNIAKWFCVKEPVCKFHILQWMMNVEYPINKDNAHQASIIFNITNILVLVFQNEPQGPFEVMHAP